MGTAAAIAAIGAAHSSKLIPHKMFIAGPAMPTVAKNSNLVYKITLLQSCIFTKVISAFAKAMADKCKYTLTFIKPV